MCQEAKNPAFYVSASHKVPSRGDKLQKKEKDFFSELAQLLRKALYSWHANITQPCCSFGKLHLGCLYILQFILCE